MSHFLHFSTRAKESSAGEMCPLCKAASPLFVYSLSFEVVNSGTGGLHDQCCLRCGQQLLASMGELLLAQWAQGLRKPDSKV
jgi:hypothetical protein